MSTFAFISNEETTVLKLHGPFTAWKGLRDERLVITSS